MKRKFFKIASILLSVALLLTAIFVFPVSSATELTLYVCSPGCDAYDTKTDADGTAQKPFETVYDLITYVNANTDLGAGDTVKVIVEELATINTFANAVHNMTSWTDQVVSAEAIVPAYAYTLYITSPQGEKNHLAFSHKLAANGDLMIGGPTVFDNIILVNNTNSTGKNIAFEGASVTFTENCDFQYTKNATTSQFGTLVDMPMDVQLARATNSGKTVTYAGAEYNLESANLGAFIFGSNRGYKLFPTYTEDVNINVDNAALAVAFKWGSNVGAAANSTIKFSKNLNINVKDAASVTNTVYNFGTVVIDGALQAIYPEDVTFDMSAITNLTAGSKWFLVNKTGNADALSFTATAGVYNVAEGLTVSALNSDGSVAKTSENGVLDLTSVGAGTYSIVEGTEGGTEPEPDPKPEITVTNDYAKYITYRSDLDNTRTKLQANGDVNVVYFGGSVTAGSGASDKDATSWRALTGNWIKSAFPNANVTNYDQAVGETGTYLGSYRVARDIIGKNPDLLFIEYSINDYYNHTGYARASLQFETIVRQVKESLPNCDIVTILVTDFNQAKNALKGELHAAAKAHSDISATYGLPVINVGFALADALGASWTPAASYKEDAVWGEYVTDLVHPKDKGYAVYFNVIKEYLSNNLVMEYNGETAFTELTDLPATVNKYLLDGDVTFLKPDNSMIIKNEENTATTRKLAYDTSRSGMCDGYGYSNGNVIWFGSRTDCGDILKFEFTGTEIVMIATALTEGEYSMVSIDGGEAYRVDHTSKPVVLATNLSSGKHTIEFKQITQSASLIINGFYTRDFTKATNTLNICDLVRANECITDFAKAEETEFFDYSNDWANDAADINALKQILLNK